MRTRLWSSVMMVAALSTATVADAQAAARARAWYGDYVYEHYAGTTAGGSGINITYRLHLGDDGCRVDIEGYQSNDHLRCSARMQGNSLVIGFLRFDNGGVANQHGVQPYAVGERLMTLTRSSRGIVTRWGSVRPEGNVPAHALRRARAGS